MSEFVRELEELINSHSVENQSGTPDFILAEYLRGCLDNYAQAVKARDLWYGWTPTVAGQPAVDNAESERLDEGMRGM